jgi:adenine-specific DNA-methyltransferase
MNSCILLVAKQPAKRDSNVIVAEIDQDDLPRFAAGNSNELFRFVKVSDWQAHRRFRFNPRVGAKDIPLLLKIEKDSAPFGSICDLTQGLTLYRRSSLVERFGKAKADAIMKGRLFHSDRKKDKTFKKELLGRDVDRYFVAWNGESWVSYGDWLAHPVNERFFHGPRLTIQKIRNPSLRRRLVAGYLDDDETYSAGVLLNAIPHDKNYSLFYCLGILNSRLLSYWYRKMILDVSIRVADLKDVPIRKINFRNASQKTKYDLIVDLVQELIALKKKSGGEDNHRTTACDDEIERLVFDLYEIPERDRKIVIEEIGESVADVGTAQPALVQ